MTMTAIPLQFFPNAMIYDGYQNVGLAATGLTIDNAADRLAFLFTSPYTDSISKVYFRTATVTVGCDLDVRVETVTNGRPSGTLWAANTNIVVAVANADDNVWKTATLTAAASLTRGNQVAVVMTVNAVPLGTPNMVMAAASVNVPHGNGQYPLVLQDATGSWALNTAATSSIEWIIEFSTGGVMYVPGCNPLDGNVTAATYNSGSTPDEKALRFQVATKKRCIGARVFMMNNAAGADFTVTLWPASSTTDADALAQVAIDGDSTYATSADGYFDLFFATAVTLSTGTTYYLGVRADTANNVTLAEMAVPSGVTNAMLALPITSAIYKSARTWTAGSAGAWTDTTTTLPMISLIFDQEDDGAGAGGGGGTRVIGG